jgi:hypothetical protein
MFITGIAWMGVAGESDIGSPFCKAAECPNSPASSSGAQVRALSASPCWHMACARPCAWPTLIPKLWPPAGTVEANRLSDRVSVYCSDNLRTIPATECWDLVVSNPPHFAEDYLLGAPTAEYAGDLRAHDLDWNVHREFFANISRFLKPSGVILLQENTAGSTADTFKSMIEESGLEIIFVQGSTGQRTTDARIYWIGIKRAGDTTPSWAIQL